ncbi:hypothetical protein JCM8547_003820 [Rhodosporidiobolus lusitaniae]
MSSQTAAPATAPAHALAVSPSLPQPQLRTADSTVPGSAGAPPGDSALSTSPAQTSYAQLAAVAAPPAAQTPPDVPPDRFNNPLSDAARAAKSASQWNGLLKWARGVRLAQGGVGGGWDFGSGGYYVPQDSPEYWSGVQRAAEDPSAARSSRPTTITSHPVDSLSDDEDGAAQENLSGRPRRKAAGRSGYADLL